MNSTHLTGLGEPDAAVKRTLLQPPMPEVMEDKNISIALPDAKPKKKSPKNNQNTTRGIRRVRITTELTVEAIQQDYRLKHGKVLLQSKVFSQAIASYAKARGIGKQA
jgi:hypothetical protein